jgi:hypothetical protein
VRFDRGCVVREAWLWCLHYLDTISSREGLEKSNILEYSPTAHNFSDSPVVIVGSVGDALQIGCFAGYGIPEFTDDHKVTVMQDSETETRMSIVSMRDALALGLNGEPVDFINPPTTSDERFKVSLQDLLGSLREKRESSPPQPSTAPPSSPRASLGLLSLEEPERWERSVGSDGEIIIEEREEYTAWAEQFNEPISCTQGKQEGICQCCGEITQFE